MISSTATQEQYFGVDRQLCHWNSDLEYPKIKGVFLQLRNEFEFPAKTIFSNISTAIGVTAVSYL